MEKSGFTPEEMASLSKERPQNETDKRFVLSEEDFSEKHLTAVKEEVDEIKEKYPEVLSLCLFGSMVKGTAHEDSDIDGYLFIDSASAAAKENIPEEQIIKYHQTRNDVYFTDEVAGRYTHEFRDGLKQKTGLEDKDVEHIRSRPISERVINDSIQAALQYQKAKEQYYKDLDQYDIDQKVWVKNTPKRGQSIEVILEHQKNKPKRPVSPDPVSTSLGSMFHLDVGGGIGKYRKMLFTKLVELGPAGEEIWKSVIGNTERMENNLRGDPSKRYPRTLVEAIEIYGR